MKNSIPCTSTDVVVGRIDVTIIVPVYNEAETLPITLSRIRDAMGPSAEIIVVDDGCSDGTSEWLRSQDPTQLQRVIHRRRNYGKGSAIRLGIRHSKGRVVAIQDADLEYDPADLARAIEPILQGESKVVYGSRYLSQTSGKYLHRSMNRLLTTLSNLSTGLSLTDMETCHKAFDGDLVRSLRLREQRFGIEPEITAKIAALGIKIDEVPTSYRARSYSEGKKITWRDGVSALVCLWRYRIR
ncbi:glycosyltransferase family 2 protein [Rubripirellula amarantea]|nr:glycosyltransferase family 2 protein [Rubripirellula amarantea]